MVEEFFRTARLIFRPFAEQDLDDLARIASDPDVVRFTDDGQPLSRDMAELWIARSRQNVKRYGYGTGALIELSTRRFIGWAGFARPEGAPEEIIYGFERGAWGKGYGTEIVERLIRFAFERLGLTEIRATTASQNAASQRILRKHAFESLPRNETDVLLFVLRKPTWQAKLATTESYGLPDPATGPAGTPRRDAGA